MTEPIAGGAPSLRALAAAAWGLLVVVLDLRVNEVDLVPDPLGWLLALLALGSLARLHRAFAVAAVAAGLGLAVSVPDWIDPGLAVLTTATSVAESVLVFATCTGIMTVAPERRASANAIRWWDLGLSLALLPLAALAPTEPFSGVLALLVGLAILVVFVCFLVLLFRTAGRPGKTIRHRP